VILTDAAPPSSSSVVCDYNFNSLEAVECWVVSLRFSIVQLECKTVNVCRLSEVHIISGYLSVNSPELIFDLVNAKPGTNHSTNPTNPDGNSKR